MCLSAVQGTPEPRYEDTVIVLFDGSLIWVPMMTIYSTCPMDLRNFPYDTQVCTMVFGSWKYSSKDMSVTVSCVLDVFNIKKNEGCLLMMSVAMVERISEQKNTIVIIM